MSDWLTPNPPDIADTLWAIPLLEEKIKITLKNKITKDRFFWRYKKILTIKNTQLITIIQLF